MNRDQTLSTVACSGLSIRSTAGVWKFPQNDPDAEVDAT